MKTRGQIFNPSVENYETLKKIIVEREEELKTITERLRVADLKGTSRSFIIIGQRGTGKTHLLLLIYHEIKSDSKLDDKYISLKFSEEEYTIHSLTDLLIRILEELKRETKEDIIKEKINKLLNEKKNLTDDELIEKSKKTLEKLFKEYDKKIVLCADNLNLIFNNISNYKKNDLKHLRSILQSKDYMVIIGFSPTYFEEIKNHEEPFYNFFEVIRLKPLSSDGVEKLIKKLAETEGDNHIIENFDEYKPKIETIIHFTGGLPRLVRMLYYVIAKAEMSDVVDLLDKLLDELTPYYQSKMQNLSQQKQKIIDIMSSMDGPSTPTEIAEEGRIDRASVNTQLRKLKKEGLVTPIKQEKRKSTRYDITERMFRIWRQMRQAKGKNRIQYLADFLKAFYTKSDFEKHINKIDEKFSNLLKHEMEIDEEKFIREYELLKDIIPEDFLPDLEAKLIDKYIKTDMLQKAEKELEEIRKIKEKQEFPPKFENKLHELEKKMIDKYLEKEPKNVSRIIDSVQYKIKHGKEIRKSDIEKFDKIIESEPDNEKARFWKAISLGELKRFEESIEEFENLIKINPEHKDALYGKALSHLEFEQYEEAIKVLNKVLQLNPDHEEALFLKGHSLFNLLKIEESLNVFKKLKKINPNFKNLRISIANTYFMMGKYEEAKKEFNEELKLDPNNESALIGKGVTISIYDSKKKAIEEYSKVLKTNPENKVALLGKSIAYMDLHNYEKAIDGFKKVLDIYPENDLALESLGKCYVLDINIKEFLNWLDDLSKTKKESFYSLIEDWEFDYDPEIINAMEFLKRFKSIEKKNESFEQFFNELIKYLIKETLNSSLDDSENKNYGHSLEKLSLLLEKKELWIDEDIEVNNLLLDYIEESIKIDLNHGEKVFDLLKKEIGEDFKRTFKILDNAIKYLKSRDNKILEKLFPEEREVAEELIKEIENKSKEEYSK